MATAIAVPSGLGVPAAATAGPSVAAAAASSDPVADGSKTEEDYALEQAAATGQPYELLSARTESSDTWALPDGSWSVKRHGTPVRMLRDGAWISTDPTLAFTSDGRVAPKASTVAVSFSGGGSGALLQGAKDGRTLSLAWPKPLPKPTLAENVATYSEILPGVDLQLKAEVEGFSQLLVVKTSDAALNPELKTLTYKLDTVGVTVSTDADTGSVTATNPAGQTVFTSPSPLMWDSTTITSTDGTLKTTAMAAEDDAPADQFVPPPGAQDAQMATAVTDGTLEITPDQDLLTGPATRYPVYIDPSWSWGERQNWTRVYKAYPNTSYWNTKDVVRVGYEAQTGGSDRVSRSFFQMDVGDLKGAKVKSSTFRVRNTWSWSCQDRPVQLWHVGPISKKTTWNRQPAKYTRLATVNDSKGWSEKIDGCGAGNLEFSATSKVAEAASKGWASITFGLYAADETDTYGWKKFDPKTATLETVYNFPPKAPEKLGTNPSTSCSSGGLIGNTKISLYATVKDRDGGNLTSRFRVFKSGSSTALVDKTVPAANGRVVTLAVPDADLPTGSYTWQVSAKDKDGAESNWSKSCKFTVDRDRPSDPPIITSQDNRFPPGDSEWSEQTGKARSPGLFVFTPNGVKDVDSYFWWTDHDPSVRNTKPGTPVTVVPPSYGPHLVYAYSVDRAGNRSDTATYLYYANRSETRDIPGDLNGDQNLDIWSTDSNGTLLTYAGQGSTAFATATNGGDHSFAGAVVGSRGDWSQDGYNDLVALEYDGADKRKRLYTYANNGTGVIEDSPVELTVRCPVENLEFGCPYTGDRWHDADEVISAGDLNGDTEPDLLVKQDKQLWAYYGNRGTLMLDIARDPVLVGSGDWDEFTVIAPGDLNSDGMPDLWLRHDTTGDLYRAYGTKGPDGYVDVTTWGAAGKRVKVGTGFAASAYPTIGSVGDVDNDGYADLWARKKDNTMHGWPGKAPGTDGSTFGKSYLIDGITGGFPIPAGASLNGGQSYSSRSMTLTMREDGNLVIASRTGSVVWQTGTAGNSGAKAQMQTDGNLTVVSASGKKLWSTNMVQSAEAGPGTVTPELTENGYAVLQDRGNLVLYNSKGQSVWSSGTAIRHDYTNDGRSDMADWYDYADGHDELHVFPALSNGAFNAPVHAWKTDAGNYWADHMKRVTGDFNGDGIGDVAAFYGYDTGQVSLRTWLGNEDGQFSDPITSWSTKPGNWTFEHIYAQAGDFNGDGRDDIAAWYAYGDGSDKLYTFTANTRGGFNTPFSSVYRAEGWTAQRMKFATGDYDGDGRDDLGALYGYTDGRVKLITFLTKPTGGFNEPLHGWESTGWTFANASIYSGDFNGDGRDDIASWYDYGDGHDAVISFNASQQDGKFGNRQEILNIDAGSYERSHMQLVTGDYNGDGRDDLATVYGYTDGHVKTITWTAKLDGTLNGPLHSWETADTWTFDRMHMIERYSPA
ncbi:FG-GAP-like repeat-containing protein [Streptomyces sp. x-45]|uniref:FG-GAP-like repeat-containing protein n=1 Tax=Streptomyces sp. x-45 TaxID=2789281 RepID=UPI00397F3D0D